MRDDVFGTTVVFILCCVLGVAYFSGGFLEGEKYVYYKLGVKARQNSQPVTAWPYDAHQGPEFEWVVGWHAADKIERTNRSKQ